jgi:hypothetical protein
MKFPDDETLRKLREFEKHRPTPQQQRQIDALSRMSNAERRAIEELTRPTTYAERRAREKLDELGAFETHTARRARLEMEAVAALTERSRVLDQMREVAGIFGLGLRQQLARQMEMFDRSSVFHAAEKEQYRIARQMIEGIYREPATQEVLQRIRAVPKVSDSPVRLALETIRSMDLEVESPVFTNFVDDALKQTEPLTKRTLKKVSKTHLSRKKISRLTEEQKFWLMFLLQFLGDLIAFITLVLTIGAQAATIPAVPPPPPVSITNVYQVTIPTTTPVYYLVRRECELLEKPESKSDIVFNLPSGEKVTQLLRNHEWLNVKYEKDSIVKEGWVKKKYLERLSTGGDN